MPSDAKRVIERTARVVTARRAVPSSSAVTAMDHEEYNPFLDAHDPEDGGFGPEGAFAGLSSSSGALGVEGGVDPRLTRSAAASDAGASGSVFAGSASANAPKTVRSDASADVPSGGGSSSFVGGTSDPNAPAPRSRRGWIFSVSYYQQFFDVDTDEVLKRIGCVFTSPHKGDFLDEVVAGNPDLYVPVWGCATLVFFTALGSAWATYNSHNQKTWDFDAKTVSLSAALIYGYVFLFSLIVHLTLTCYARVDNLRVSDIWCLYGYSVITFIPVCILATVKYELFRWLFTAACAAMSTLFLTSNVRRRVLSSSARGTAFAVSFISFIGAAHFAFALVLKLFFFQYYFGH